METGCDRARRQRRRPEVERARSEGLPRHRLTLASAPAPRAAGCTAGPAARRGGASPRRSVRHLQRRLDVVTRARTRAPGPLQHPGTRPRSRNRRVRAPARRRPSLRRAAADGARVRPDRRRSPARRPRPHVRPRPLARDRGSPATAGTGPCTAPGPVPEHAREVVQQDDGAARHRSGGASRQRRSACPRARAAAVIGLSGSRGWFMPVHGSGTTIVSSGSSSLAPRRATPRNSPSAWATDGGPASTATGCSSRATLCSAALRMPLGRRFNSGRSGDRPAASTAASDHG